MQLQPQIVHFMLITAFVTWSQLALSDMTLSQWTDGKKISSHVKPFSSTFFLFLTYLLLTSYISVIASVQVNTISWQ